MKQFVDTPCFDDEVARVKIGDANMQCKVHQNPNYFFETLEILGNIVS